ncbi:MAG: hypothetical protein KJ000_36150 [Pirellulaceae bacterium]|nr:hypothetical protein [Pirellulaceae bacterium]
MSIEEYLAWRKGAGDLPLARQLQAAIAATGQSTHAVREERRLKPSVARHDSDVRVSVGEGGLPAYMLRSRRGDLR